MGPAKPPTDFASPNGDAATSNRAPDGGKEHRTVTRVASILELVAAAEPDGLRLGSLAQSLAAPKSSIHGLVRGLVARGYLVATDDQYRIGPAPAALLTPRRLPLIEIARRPMEQLRDEFDETVALSTLVGDSYVYIAMVESEQLIHFSTPLGRRGELYPRSPGKIYLASMSSRRFQSYFASRLERKFELTDVVADLEATREKGYSVNHEEAIPGLSGVAAGVIVDGHVKSTVSIAGPSARMVTRFEAMGTAVRDAAGKISRQLA